MQTSEKGIAFIKANEGFAAHVYNDNGKAAIGYGHDLQPGEDYLTQLTEQEADTLLRLDLKNRFEPGVNSLVPPTCTQGQFDACVSFAYNLGVADLKTMLYHGWLAVPAQMPRWCYKKDPVTKEMVKDEKGLLTRRMREVEMFNS